MKIKIIIQLNAVYIQCIYMLYLGLLVVIWTNVGLHLNRHLCLSLKKMRR